MGFFSWKCPHCGQTVMNEHSGVALPRMQVTVVTPAGLINGIYDGYGRVSGTNLMDHPDIPGMFKEGEDGNFAREIKMYHQACFVEAGAPSFEKAKWSESHGTGQGYWEDE